MWRVPIAALVLVAGCGAHGGYVIERTVGGARRSGVFVAPSSYEHFVRAELLAARGDLAGAAAHYEEARAGAADDPLLAARLADVRDRLGDRERAERTLDEGERIAPCPEAIWTARGAIAERHGEPERAIVAYERAIACGEGDEEPVLALARVLRDSGAAERAEAVLESYLRAQPGHVGAARARLALALGRADARTAGLAALELVRASAGHTAEIEAAVRATLAAGQAPLAGRLVALLPDGALSAEVRLEVMLANGDRDAAEALLLAWAPESVADLLAVAAARLALGDGEAAIELARVAEARGAGAEAAILRARAELEAGRIGEAATAAMSVAPGSSGRQAATAVVNAALARAGLPALAAEARAAER